MEVASIPDLSLAECLQVAAKQFDTQAIANRKIDSSSVLDYYKQSDRGYRLFHSREGAMHVALNCDEEFSTSGYLGQVSLIAEKLPQEGNILEVGCGTGFNLRNMASRLPDCQLTGVDLSVEHVEGAVKEASKYANVRFEQGDFHQLRFDDAAFDAVFAIECLCQGTDWQGALAEIQRVLRPGGKLIVIDCFRDAPLETYDTNLQLAARLVEKTMAVEEFAVCDDWLQQAQEEDLSLIELQDLSSNISHNLARFYSLSRRFFKMPMAARAFLKAFPQRLLENSISGLLMPFTVGGGVHRYYMLTLEKR
ncbi:class I SAM-dependent methyltransferase [Bythopirellula polymerisocia]|uniref:Demethylrebeccamycin-D-glucose O-methyltransferase n=1 Tax=Bythopirellula polymerisocia TaxID=2528003 RepID=A0A5C6CS58_9BACT|nr:class I SAM-dependent methyltransferase [Bythopirellula polymerisocia]TWU25649.1 Demethylrebeccamycin-D-glucose O-methyltransferase [Bythopirellula polymerisocia]